MKKKLTLTLCTSRQVLWAFFSHSRQAVPFRAALQSFFMRKNTPQLTVNADRDPCQSFAYLKPLPDAEREKMSRQFHKYRKARAKGEKENKET